MNFTITYKFKLIKHVLVTVILVVNTLISICKAQEIPQNSSAAQTMSLDVNNTDIRDVVRMISRGYNLNIIIDKDVKGAVTLHLSSVPILEGIAAIANSLGLDVERQGDIYLLHEKKKENVSSIEVLNGNRLKVDVRNTDVRSFLVELSKKSGTSIVLDESVQGNVTGKLVNVPFDDGLKAILEGNGYNVVSQKGIYRVTSGFDLPGSPVKRRAVSDANYPFIINVNNGLITLDAHDADLEDVLRAVTKESGVQLVTYGDISGKINAQINDVTFDDAMEVLLGGTRFTYIKKGKIILAGDRNASTPSGQALSTSEMITLNHLKAEDVPSEIPVNIPAANIKVIKEQNALLVTGTNLDIARIKEFLNTIDVPTPQIIIDVIVVEYSMDKDFDFGFDFGLDASVKNQNSFPSINFSRQGSDAKNLLDKILPSAFMKNLGYLGDDFYFRLQLLASQNKAKVLAKPSLTVLNGHKASINVGQTQYFKIITGTSESMTYKFQPISFGIDVSITPWVTPGGQITTDVAPEISNAMGINSDGYPNVFTRSVNTTVRLNNNETLVLGGLIRHENQLSYSKVPFLGDIPILGNIFKTTKKVDIATNLSIYMTPHIIDKDMSAGIGDRIKEFGLNDKDIFPDDISETDSSHTKSHKSKSAIKTQCQSEVKDTLKSKKDTLQKKIEPVKNVPAQPLKADTTMIIDVPHKNRIQNENGTNNSSTQDNSEKQKSKIILNEQGKVPYENDDYYIPKANEDN